MIVIRLRYRTAAALAAALAVVTAAQAQLGGVAGGFRAAMTPVQEMMQALQQIRLTSCAPVFQQAGNFLFENGQAKFVVQPLGADANRWPTVVTMETRHAQQGPKADGQTRFTTLIVAPAGTCSGMYQQVIYWPEPCARVKARVFAAFRNERPVLARVQQSEVNPGLQLYLMPAGPGCVSVKKELIG